MSTILIFVAALALRLFLSPLAFHVDILSNAGWGAWIYLHGPMGFYANNIWIYSWPTQPPFVSLIYGFDNWLYVFILEAFRNIGNVIVQYHLAPGHLRFWFTFTKWFDTAKIDGESVFSIGYLVSIKILPILADLGIAAILYKISKNIIWPAIYLFSPFSWYLSSLWGQYDQLSFLPLFLALFLESRKKFPILTPFLFALSIAIKPTSLILVPFFVYVYFKNSHKKIYWEVSIILIALLFWITTQVFTNLDVLTFSKETLVGKIFFKSATRLSANAFNFWRILQSSGSQTAETKFLFIPAFVWSLAIYIYLNLIAFKKNIFTGAFIIFAGSWMFMTNMMDRYLFAGIVTGLVVSIHNPKIFKYWLVMSLIFWINLYNQWFFPSFLDPLKSVLIWNGGFVTKILSLINVAVLLLQFRELKALGKSQEG